MPAAVHPTPVRVVATDKRWASFLCGFFAAVAAIAAHAPLVSLHVKRMWGVEHYQYLPFLLAAVVVIGWKRLRQPLQSRRSHRSQLFVPTLLAGVGCLGVAVLLWSPWLATLAAILSGYGLLLGVAPRPAARRLATVWLLWLLILPLPFGWDFRLISQLQFLAARLGSDLLEFLRVDHVLAGSTIEVSNRTFLVEEACSGARSFFSLVTMAAVLAVYAGRGLLHGGLLILAGAIWAIALNVIRIVTTVAVYQAFNIDISLGWRHQVAGIAVFILAAFLLLGTDRLLLFFCSRSDPVVGRPPAHGPRAARHLARQALLLLVALGFALLCVVQVKTFQSLGVAFGGEAAPLEWARQSSSLKKTMGPWSLVDFQIEQRSTNSIFGKHSSIWRYESDDSAAIVSLDYPFVGWHPLQDCYAHQGWIVEPAVTVPQSEFSSDEHVAVADLTRPPGEHARLLFCEFDSSGELLPRPRTIELGVKSWQAELRNRWARAVARTGRISQTYQLQVLATSSRPLTEEQILAIEWLFQQVQNNVLTRFRSQAREL